MNSPAPGRSDPAKTPPSLSNARHQPASGQASAHCLGLAFPLASGKFPPSCRRTLWKNPGPGRGSPTYTSPFDDIPRHHCFSEHAITGAVSADAGRAVTNAAPASPRIKAPRANMASPFLCTFPRVFKPILDFYLRPTVVASPFTRVILPCTVEICHRRGGVAGAGSPDTFFVRGKQATDCGAPHHSVVVTAMVNSAGYSGSGERNWRDRTSS